MFCLDSPVALVGKVVAIIIVFSRSLSCEKLSSTLPSPINSTPKVWARHVCHHGILEPNVKCDCSFSDYPILYFWYAIRHGSRNERSMQCLSSSSQHDRVPGIFITIMLFWACSSMFHDCRLCCFLAELLSLCSLPRVGFTLACHRDFFSSHHVTFVDLFMHVTLEDDHVVERTVHCLRGWDELQLRYILPPRKLSCWVSVVCELDGPFCS